MIAHTRTWQFQLDQLAYSAAAALTNDRLVMIGKVGGMLGRGAWVDKDNVASASAGNWTVWGSNDGVGGFGNGDAVNRWDTAGVLDPTKLVWAAAGVNHSWIVLQQTGIAASYQVCIDLSSATTTTATVVVSFTSGFGLAAGGTDGTATARPTAADQQILVSNTSWGGGGVLGSAWHVMKSTDGQAFRFFVTRSNAVVGFYQFEIPDPVVSGWTTPSIAHGIGNAGATEQVTYARMVGANTYGKTPGGTIFASSYCQAGSQSDTNILTQAGSGFGGCPNEVDGTDTLREIGLYSATVNARNLNGKVVDAYWGSEPGITLVGSLTGSTVPSGGPIQWARMGCLWVPWVAGNLPRTQV